MFKKGDRVISKSDGIGTVTDNKPMFPGDPYPVEVAWDNGDTNCYTLEGCAYYGEEISIIDIKHYDKPSA